MKLLLTSIVFLGLLSASCQVEETINGGHIYEFDRETFNEQRAQWQGAKHANYQFAQELRNGGGPQGLVKITVSNGQKTEEVCLTEDRSEYRIFADTIDEVFRLIETNVTADKERLDNKELQTLYVTIEYDDIWHYPKKISYSLSRPGGTEAPDGGIGYRLTITDFKPATE